MKKSSLLLFFQYSGISVFYLLIAYPVLHESGHILAAIILGGKIVKISYLPLPSITCNFIAFNPWDNAAISFIGILLPIFVFAILPKNKKKYPVLNFGTLLFEIIIVFSLVFAFANCIFTFDASDDIVKIVGNSPELDLLFLIIIIIMLIIVFGLGLLKQTHLAIIQFFQI